MLCAKGEIFSRAKEEFLTVQKGILAALKGHAFYAAIMT